MTLPTDSPRFPSSVGHGAAEAPVAPLDPFVYQDMQFCPRCGGEQIFVEVYECAAGRMGFCLGCGEEKLVRFTRTVEAACNDCN